ncbi:MAG: ATP-dependent DNA helicase [Ottowia sp.]
MPDLASRVAAVFAEQGPLAGPVDAASGAQAAYRPRSGQLALAQAVAETMQGGGALVAEAATGVGKTFAYLVPALLLGERVLLSTATKTLQDQLYGRDLPRLIGALGLPTRTALLKGRASYLCPYRLELARHEAPPGPAAARELARIERWAQATATGDLAELPELDERSPVIALVTSTRENCLGSECPRFRDCHVARARRTALEADLIVINHHLFFADLAIRETGMAELLPHARAVVFDEAHQLNETGIQFLGRHISHRHLQDLARDTLAAGLQHARGLADWAAIAGGLHAALQALRQAVAQAPIPPGQNARLRWSGPAPEHTSAEQWQPALAQLAQALHTSAQACQHVQDAAADFPRLRERAQRLAELAERFARPMQGEAVRWLEVGLHTLQLTESPLDIAATVRERLLGLPPPDTPGTPDSSHTPEAPASADDFWQDPPPEPPEPPEPPPPPRAWVFVSATLGDDAQLSWFTRPCGLQGQARILRIGSPFDYPRQAALYIPAPARFPLPQQPEHPQAIARLAARASLQLGGRTLVLTTTLRALRSISHALEQQLPAQGIRVLTQGQAPKRELMQQFRAGDGSGGGSILVASASFWEGVDIPGPALQCVLIDKLPFPPPGDPLIEARSHRIQAAGGSPFSQLALPETAIALKQGAGRLIRCETDTGLLIIGDTRLLTQSYGRRLLAALPPMRRIHTETELAQTLTQLADSV